MKRRYHYRPWKEESLISALHFLRCRIVREEQEGLEYADALLRQLGVDPQTLPMPRKTPHHFPRGALQRAILDILRDGPLTGAEIAAAVPCDLDARATYKRTYQALTRMKRAGMLRHEGGFWGVCPIDGGGDP